MDEVGIELMADSGTGNRCARLGALGNHLGLEGLGEGTAWSLHLKPAYLVLDRVST